MDSDVRRMALRAMFALSAQSQRCYAQGKRALVLDGGIAGSRRPKIFFDPSWKKLEKMIADSFNGKIFWEKSQVGLRLVLRR